MKEIICDTNIWYGLGNGSITKPDNVKLYATWNNLIEIGFSHPKIKEQIDVSAVQSAANAILTFADEIIENDPFMHSVLKIAPALSIKTKSLQHILEEIVKSGLPNEDTYKANQDAYNVFMKIKEEFADELNIQKTEVRKKVLSSSIEKEKFKVADNVQLDEQAYSLLLDVDSFLDKEHELKIVFDKEDDYREILNSIRNKFELYVHVKQKFLKKWILEKSMQIERNDYYDLLNLVYIEKGQFYWTKEKRWITAMKESGMDKYIWQ